MYCKIPLVLLLFDILQRTSGVIYSLNETEYDRLPPLFQLDPYFPCLRTRGDRYCYLDARLVSDEHSELLTLIQEYSANNLTHYDHTLIHWGVCVTKTCRDQLSNSTDLNTSLEACLNRTLTKSHQLQTRLVEDKVFCTKFGETRTRDMVDLLVAVLLLGILVLNIVGSFYDFCSPAKNSLAGRFLVCFSVRSNWLRLVAPSGEGPEPKLRRLKCLNGLKAITTFLVVMGHSPLAALITANNPQFIESTYHDPTFHVFYNGNLIVQTFLLVSGFLLAYNILILEEKRTTSWEMLPKGIVLRWLRLIAPYAVVLGVISTWLRYFGDGPMWKPVVLMEASHCRRDWFYNLMFVNNYVDHSHCMAHTWYLAADLQLTVIGLFIFCVLRGRRARKVAVAATLVAGLIGPAVETYLHNLHAKLLVTPEVSRHYFVEDPTFNHLYKRTHTNLVCYAMGLALGLWLHALQATDIDIQKYKKYRFVYWGVFPVGLLLIISGGVFFIDGVRVPLGVRMLLASLLNPLFGAMGFILLPANVFKLENVYRGILEWRGWAPLGRMSYCAYLLHVSVVRTSVANHTSLTHANFYLIFLTYCGLLVITFLLAAPCWMLVESPFSQLAKLALVPSRPSPTPKVLMDSKFNTKAFDEA